MLFISQEKYDSLHSGKIAENDLVLCLRGATFGKVARVKPYKIGAIASSLVIIRCYEYSLAEYLYYYLRSDLAIQQLHLYDNGSAQPNLAAGDVQKYLFPLPPIKEALMISERISILLALVSKISQEKRNLNAIIVNIKTKILDLAIRGQLVPQNPDDEPASALLERIRIEKEELIKQGKIKRDKKESIIFKGEDNSYYEKICDKVINIDKEIPFELPESWEWCRGYSCFSGMETRKPKDEFFDYIDIDAIDNHLHKIKETKHIPSSKAPSRASRAVNDGSVLFSMVRPYLKNIAFVDNRHSQCIASTGFYVCNSNGAFLPEYMFFLMISDYVVKGLNQLGNCETGLQA